ncbi:MAG: deoxyguanosinetriphosphate triphosphohydrolase [Lentisphaeria bacterium]|nr:deoxyguanosinetriphosphate triphosphohydrolase [Lentisphaeria bacterium]
MKMEWAKLVSPHRLGKTSSGEERITQERSPFQRDFDRIIFSSAFRRMQDKTQVFPLASNDYVRTRLTHCLETSSIARSLGTAAGVFLCEHYDTGGAHPSDIGAIVAAAALAHDIGNPPLGHGGEESIRHWFTHSEIGKSLKVAMSPAECADIEQYEGNAHGFRVLTVLQMPDQRGGMQLTCATLGAFAKYPRAALTELKPPGVAGKKYNFFQADKALFAEVAETLGLIRIGQDSYCRHPLAFLVEAADDIAYRIVDFEDAHMVGVIPYEELERDFLEIIGEDWVTGYLQKLQLRPRKAEFLRAQVIGVLVRQAVQVFCDRQEDLLRGTLEQSLIDLIPAAPVLQRISRRSAADIYNTPKVAAVIAAGFELLAGMLDVLVPAVNEIATEANGGAPASYRSRRMIKILPPHYAPVHDEKWRNSAYLRLLYVLDYLAGMTDSYAVNLYKQLKGISL